MYFIFLGVGIEISFVELSIWVARNSDILRFNIRKIYHLAMLRVVLVIN